MTLSIPAERPWCDFILAALDESTGVKQLLSEPHYNKISNPTPPKITPNVLAIVTYPMILPRIMRMATNPATPIPPLAALNGRHILGAAGGDHVVPLRTCAGRVLALAVAAGEGAVVQGQTRGG
jgi:hypothetical protein